ncbi:MAG: nucleotide sugar dehydrogenase [Pseudonocardiales bacterium]
MNTVRDRISIVGAGGHIGLPLSVVLAEAGFDVYGIDRSSELNSRLNQGEIPYVEHGAQPLMNRALSRGNLRFTADDSSLATSDVIVVIIGTPVDDNLNPRIDPLIEVMKRHASRMPHGQLIVLRSTVSPGTTELLRAVLETGSGTKEGEGFFLVFAPERVLQTRAVEEIQSLPQLVGAFCDASFDRASSFFSRFVSRRTIRLTPVEAELGKLITNMSRYVSFALANEFYMICDSHGANAHSVIAACNEDYPRLDLPRPGPNVGGPCLYKDGYYLTEKIQFPEIIANSFKINESVPRYLLEKVRAVADLKRVGVLGLAFKANCDDTRNSLSYKLIKQVKGMHAEPIAVDPYVPQFADPTHLKGVDALFLMTPHDEFKNLPEWLTIVDNPNCIVVDMWNFWTETSALSHDGVYRAGNVQSESPMSLID